jgi:hypothetical protein
MRRKSILWITPIVDVFLLGGISFSGYDRLESLYIKMRHSAGANLVKTTEIFDINLRILDKTVDLCQR